MTIIANHLNSGDKVITLIGNVTITNVVRLHVCDKVEIVKAYCLINGENYTLLYDVNSPVEIEERVQN